MVRSRSERSPMTAPKSTRAAVRVLLAVGLVTVGSWADDNPRAWPAKNHTLVRRIYSVDDLAMLRNMHASAVRMPDVTQDPDNLYNLFRFKGDPFEGAEPQAVSPANEAVVDLVERLVHSGNCPGAATPFDHKARPNLKILRYGNTTALVVYQTAEGHRRIEELLAALRAASEVGGPALAIHARWVEVREDQMPAIMRRAGEQAVPAEVDAASLEGAGARTLYAGHATVFDRQATFVAVGRLKAYLAEAQAWWPGMCIMNSPSILRALEGALLEVRPQLTASGTDVLLDFRAYMNHRVRITYKPLPDMGQMKATPPPEKVDLGYPEIDFHTLRGSVRIPLDKTVLLGVTTGPDLKAGKVMCLLVEVSASK